MILYILVADRHVLRVLRYESREDVLEELITYCNFDARLNERELVSDRSGRIINGPAGIRQAYTAKVDSTEYSVQRWLRHLTRHELPMVCAEHSDALVLAADPRLLAQLRSGLVGTAYPPIVAELPRNLARQSVAELRKRLKPMLREALFTQRRLPVWRRVRRRGRAALRPG